MSYVENLPLPPPHPILLLDDKAGNPAEILWLQRHKRIRSTPTADISYEGLNKTADILETTLSNAFLSKEMFDFQLRCFT